MELAKALANWLGTQDGVTEVEVLDTNNPPFGADPTTMLGHEFIGFQHYGVPMSLELSVTE